MTNENAGLRVKMLCNTAGHHVTLASAVPVASDW